MKKTTTARSQAAAAPKKPTRVVAKKSPQPKAAGSKSKAGASSAGPQVGAPAPPFSLPSDAGNSISLSDYRGKWVVLYFYPKDHTPGCTREAIAFEAASA